MLGLSSFDTVLGTCAVVWSDAGIRGVQLPEVNAEATLARMLERFPGAQPADPPAAVRDAMARMASCVAGERVDLGDIALDMEALSPFFRRVYDAARAVPAGTTVSYGELAARVGSPGGSRAVGQAMGKNPYPIVVPCHRVLAANGKPGGFSAYGGATTKARMLAAEGVRVAAGLDFDPDEARAHVCGIDARLARLVDQVGPFRLAVAATHDTFDALARSIVYQQLAGRAAATIHGRVRDLFPRARIRPSALLDMPEAKLRGAGLSQNKLLALQDLSKKTLDGTVPPIVRLRRMHDDEIVERLTQVRGIGRWTVEMLLIFRLGRPDVLPVDDYGVRKGFARAYGKKDLPAPKDLMKVGEKWRPYRTVASWYFWRACDLSG
jgi:methylated-DNA-[protein]-cysteine S-methyltransferase